MKHLIAIFFCLGLVLHTQGQERYYGYFPDSARYVIAPSGLNLRAEPSTSASVVAKLPYATEVQSLRSLGESVLGDRVGAWEKVKYGDVVGYAFNVYLSVLPAPQLNLREDPCEEMSWYGYEFLLRQYLEQHLVPLTEEVEVLEYDPYAEEQSHAQFYRQYEKGVFMFQDTWYESSQTHVRLFGMTPDQALTFVEALVKTNCPENTLFDSPPKRVHNQDETLILIEDGTQGGWWMSIQRLSYLSVEIVMGSGV